jgi:hypothetical protein
MFARTAVSTLIWCCFDGELAREPEVMLDEVRTVALAEIEELAGMTIAVPIASALASVSRPLLLPVPFKMFSSCCLLVTGLPN